MIRYKDPEAFAIPEPRVRDIAHQLERLLALVELESNGWSVRIDGFRLRDLSKWRDHVANTAMNALTPISSVCNSKCEFCFEENVPYAREQSLMPMEEARTRLKYYSPETGRALFPSSRHHMETFIHPHALDIIELARERDPKKLFWITSNGSHFDSAFVERLARLKPIMIKLSLNVIDEEKNRQLMKTGRRTEIALNAAGLLAENRIPFMGGIVAWPTLSLDDIDETVRFLESQRAYAIRVRLPLAHKWLKHQPNVDMHIHWRRVADHVTEIRSRVSVPLFVEPPMFWVTPIVPEIDGVVLNSPAHRAGLKAGDIVRSIEGNTIRSRIESEATLDRLHLARAQTVRIEVERQEGRIECVLEEASDGRDTYPYNGEFFYRGENFGIFHVEDFRLHYVQSVIDIARRYNAHRVMLFTSSLVAPIFETLVENIPEFTQALADVEVHLETIEENSFGGNYDVMDSRVVADYADAIRKRIHGGFRPDLILIPDAFGGSWGTDVFGCSESDLSLEFGIPIERIEWLLVYGREV
jgi:uncharacterized Fe-S cluster-containing radical SAM superfamily protein